MNYISNQIAFFLSSNKIISKNDEPVYAYGAELILANMVSWLTFVVIGIVSRQLIYVCVFSVCFLVLRTYAGGYHANTRLGCYLISLFTTVIVALNAAYMPASMQKNSYIVLLLVSNLLLLRLTPVQTIVNPKTDEELKSNKKNLLKWLIVINAASLVMNKFSFGGNLYFACVEALTVVTVLCILGLIKIRYLRRKRA